MFDPPIFINCRDRVDVMSKMVSWLETAGHQRIVLLDNDSTYEPLLSYYKQTPHEVRYLGRNLGAQALWRTGMIPSEMFVYSDPDILPIEQCPRDAIQYLKDLLERFPLFPKVGLGLYLEDVPETMVSLPHERRLLMNPIAGLDEDSPVYHSAIDTTFALYWPNLPFQLTALRTGWPYQARHLCHSFYGGKLTDEDEYYIEHALPGQPHGSSWVRDARGM